MDAIFNMAICQTHGRQNVDSTTLILKVAFDEFYIHFQYLRFH